MTPRALTAEELAELRRKVDAATPGEWDNENCYGGPTIFTRDMMPAYAGDVDQSPKRRIIAVVESLQHRHDDHLSLDADAQSIVALHNAAPAFIAQALRAIRYEQALRQWDCDRCRGRGRIAAEAAEARYGENTRGGEGGETKCGKCAGVGINPIAFAALKETP